MRKEAAKQPASSADVLSGRTAEHIHRIDHALHRVVDLIVAQPLRIHRLIHQRAAIRRHEHQRHAHGFLVLRLDAKHQPLRRAAADRLKRHGLDIGRARPIARDNSVDRHVPLRVAQKLHICAAAELVGLNKIAVVKGDGDGERRIRIDEGAENELKNNAVTVVNFWFSACAPCIGELSELNALNEELKLKGGAVIGINADTIGGDESMIMEAKSILEKKGAKYQNIYFPADSEAGKLTYSITAFPTTVVVDRNGNIVGEPIVGAITEKNQAETLQSLIDQAIAADAG